MSEFNPPAFTSSIQDNYVKLSIFLQIWKKWYESNAGQELRSGKIDQIYQENRNFWGIKFYKTFTLKK